MARGLTEARKSNAFNNKVAIVMREFKAGKLRSSSGQKVKKRAQALAIALSEARRRTGRRR